MPTLFVLSHAPHTDPNEGRMLDFARPGDAVILIEDAVYGATAVGTPLTPVLAEAQARGIAVHVLEADLEARGLSTELPTVDYAGFVALLGEHERAVH